MDRARPAPALTAMLRVIRPDGSVEVVLVPGLQPRRLVDDVPVWPPAHLPAWPGSVPPVGKPPAPWH